MKARAVKNVPPTGFVECNPCDATHIIIKCPGPITTRVIPVQIKGQREGTVNWTWNGSLDAPTLRPSVLSREYDGDHVSVVCHSWITDGKVQFLTDCDHELAGQTFDLLDV